MKETPDADARRRIAEDLDATFVVEAAAGTGKTTSLVERVLSAVGAGVEMRRIVAVTFTDKAAGELKLRIRIALERRKEQSAGPARRRYERALEQLEEAHVSTIHRFAGELLRMRPIEVGVDPHFTPLSPGEARALSDEAFGRWLEASLRSPSNALRRALARHDGSVDKLKRSMLRLVEHRHLDAPWTRREVDVGAEAIATATILVDVATLAERARSKTDRLYGALRPVRELAHRIASKTLADERLEAALVEIAAGPWDTRYGGGMYGPGVERSELIAEVGKLRSALTTFVRRANAHLAVELRDDLEEGVRIYGELKARRGALDFDDLVLVARDAVAANPELAADFKATFSRFFIDEFQDTDPVQASLLLLLASKEDAPSDPFQTRLAPGRLFVVGDPKQAIYRFRHADPGTYTLVREIVLASGGEVLELQTSFRSVPGILGYVNATFEPVMTGDERSQQARYVELAPSRQPPPGETASVMALPVPEPYGTRRLAKGRIRTSLPGAVASFVAWLLSSGQTVVDPATKERTAVQPRHIAILFRQFESYGKSAPDQVSEGLTRHGVPHVVLGGSMLGGREEAHTMVTALGAIEDPDDPLLAYATLRGLFFGITDEALFGWLGHYGSLRATRLPITAVPAALEEVREALIVLAQLHRARNSRPPAETVVALLVATRAHVGFALSPSAEQAFLQVASMEQLAAAHERSGGLSFASFVDALSSLSTERAAGADVSEEEAAGVRLMTVHRAKGLEFPVVILADPAEGAARAPDKLVDVGRRLGALSLAGCVPWDLLDAHDVEMARSEAEGARIAYVAATRARDLLVLPVVGDDPGFPAEGWLSPLTRTLARPDGAGRDPPPGPDVVKNRPFDVERPRRSLSAGEAQTLGGPVLVFDPQMLPPPPPGTFGQSDLDLLSKDVPPEVVRADEARWEEDRAERIETISRGARAVQRIRTVTRIVKDPSGAPLLSPSPEGGVAIHASARAPDRPTGKRFGTLVHMILATVPLDASDEAIRAVAASVGRLVGATEAEPEAAAVAVSTALRHAIFDEARGASGGAQREVPITVALDDLEMADGVVDLTYLREGARVVVDYKTDDPAFLLPEHLAAYRAQVELYARAIGRATGDPTTAALLFV